MTRVALTIVNPGAESAIAAPWTSATGVLTRRGGTNIPVAGTNAFTNTSSGAFDFYQDVAIPSGEYAAVDAGTRVGNLRGYGANGTLTDACSMYLKALDVSNAVLATWTNPFTQYGPWTKNGWRQIWRTLPAGTRTLRVGMSGTASGSQTVYVDELTLALDDVVSTTAFTRYGAFTIDPTQCGASDTTDFEYLIRGHADWKSVGNGGYMQSIGAPLDLVFFADAACTVRVNHRAVYWYNTTGELEVWVRIPTLSHTVATVVYWGCGNPTFEKEPNNPDLASRSVVQALHHGTIRAMTWGIPPGWDSSGHGLHLGYWDNLGGRGAVADDSDMLASQIGVGKQILNFGPAYTTTRNMPDALGLRMPYVFTVKVWFYSTDIGSYRTIIIKGNGGQRNYHIYIAAGGQLFWTITKGSGNYFVAGSALGSVVVNTWYYAVGTYDGSTLRLYINGALAGSLAVAGPADSALGDCVNMGETSTAADMYSGMVDNPQIISATDGVDRILAEYNNQKAGATFDNSPGISSSFPGGGGGGGGGTAPQRGVLALI